MIILMSEAIQQLKKLIDDMDWERKDTTNLRQQLKNMENDPSKWYPLF